MSEEPTDRAAKHAIATMSFLNLMGYFASPRIVDKVKQMPTHEHLLDHIHEYLEIVDLARACPDAPGNKAMLDTELHARRLRDLCEVWMPSPEVPSEIQQTARAVLAAFGVPEPSLGWDKFEGFTGEGPQSKIESLPPALHERATFADLDRCFPDTRAEILAGRILEKECPSAEHVTAQDALLRHLRCTVSPPHGPGPGSFWILAEPVVEFEPHEVFIPDLAGWRWERTSTCPEAKPIKCLPDWVCEIVSPSTKHHDHIEKFRVYERCKVPHYWMIDPNDESLTVLEWTSKGYVIVCSAMRMHRVRAAPFEAVELLVGILFGARTE